jgi:hypothetical protein
MNAASLRTAVGVLLLLAGDTAGAATEARAVVEPGEIKVDLQFDSKVFQEDDPVRAVIQLDNTSKERALLSRGFQGGDIFLEMRVIDPAGRLLVPRRTGPHREFPDAPPLFYALHDNRFIRPLPCEIVRPGKGEKMRSVDLRDFYRMELPGRYSAQVQLSAMVFKGEPCSLENAERVFVIKSETVYFEIKGTDAKNAHANPAGARQAGTAGPAAETLSAPRGASMPSRNPAVAPAVWTGGTGAFPAATVAGSAPSKGGPPSAPVSAELLMPTATMGVHPSTEVKVRMGNLGSKTVVFMKVLGQEVYNDLSPLPPYTRKSVVDSTSFTLTYDQALDPRIDFQPSQLIRVEASSYEKNKPGAVTTTVFNFETAALSGQPDADEDGIPDDMETTLLKTSKSRKTLFVRPKKIDGGQIVYWPGFIALFALASPGFPDIPAFSQAGIEVCVIGDPGNLYPPMRNFNYDPALDPNHPPCDILEILNMPETSYCVYGNYNMGHTFFFGANPAWYWDTKGYVPNDQVSDHYQKYRYFTSLLYPLPLETYFTEGAYPRIQVGGAPVVTANCGLRQCYDCSHASPLNLNDAETGPPFTLRPDATVEFNEITFTADMKITAVGARGAGFNREEVRRRTIVHEMGHALLAASEDDHCANPDCIMYGRVVDWRKLYFGDPGACTHSPGGSKDIRAKGVVHNRVH